MNVVFVNPTDYIWGHGVNILASILRERKHKVRTVHIPSARNNIIRFEKDAWLSEFNDVDVYLVSFMSKDLPCAIDFTNFIKNIQPETPIVWGGVHPSAMPADSLSYVDYVGIMECEEALPEFLEKLEKGGDLSGVRNFWIRTPEGEILKNPARPPVGNLDDLPILDYGIGNKYVTHLGKLLPMTTELLAHYMVAYPIGKPVLYALTSRGCNFSCSYCFHSRSNEAYGSGRIRERNLKKVVYDEIKPELDRFPFLRAMVEICDDDFLHRTKEDLKTFCTIWKKEIQAPISCQAHVLSITREKMDLLMDAGLRMLQIGVQTGSEKINREIYNRHLPNEMLLDRAHILKRYVKDGGLSVICDFIIDNPYENDADIKRSIYLYLDLPFRSAVNFFSLTPYPGTHLYDRFSKDGLLSNNYEDFTRGFSLLTDKDHRYLTLLFMLKGKFAKWIPNLLIRILSSQPILSLGNLANTWLFTPILRSSLFSYVCTKNAVRRLLEYGHIIK